jgi:hypothetical protein
MVDERLLQGMQYALGCETLDRRDLCAAATATAPINVRRFIIVTY